MPLPLTDTAMYRFAPTILLAFMSLLCQAQPAVRLDSLPAGGVLLNKGWKFQTGDNPDRARPDFDDSQWEAIDPTKDIFELPQIPKTGQIGWLRIKLAIANPNRSALSIGLQQVVASEIYLNGRLIHRIGYLNPDSQRIKAVNPNRFPYSFPVTTDSVQTLAIRYAFQPNIRYSTHFGRTNPLFSVMLYPTDEAVLDYTNTYNRDQNLNFAAVWVILSLLFFTLYIFFPVRKAHLYFSVYTLLFAISWYLLSSVKLPAFVETFYWRNNASVLLETIGYLFMLNAVYATFQYKKGLLYWAMVLSGIVAVFVGALVYDWGWLLFGFFFSNFIDIDITRVSLIAVRQHRRGAWILLAGGICYLICWFVFSLQFFSIINLGDTLGGLLFDISILSISVAFAVFLAYDFGLTSRALQQKLKENEILFAEKQQLLSAQNETLEKQVQARTTDLNHSLTELKATQTQLIQREKMASLGELTAGIAHEIQNPLNFVNNFSEVSTELVSELEAEQQNPQRDPQLETELLGDLKQNLQKIAHHGQRASSIVKGMLEHSRTSTGERQPTDLTALAEEYLRLAYQGMRAKDNGFNCELVTDFDPTLGLVQVVPQEIGRVLLNLYNNAFYAVQQKQKTATSDYQPKVTVSTALVAGPSDHRAVDIRIKDNGTGIPESVKDKIFQPFFTTKPTGEGTGLGLSLSYDIVTKGHGGTLTVGSVEGDGTVFVIYLRA